MWMGAGRLDTAGVSWSVPLRTAPSSLQPNQLHSWACSSLSCKSPGSLAGVVVERAQPSSSSHVSALCNPTGMGHTPLLAHPGDLCWPRSGLCSPQLSTAPLCGRLHPNPLHLLPPGLGAMAPGASASTDRDVNNCSWLCSIAISSPLQYTCPLPSLC